MSIQSFCDTRALPTLNMHSGSQNIYDDPKFFSAYGTLQRSQQGLAAAPEWPSLRQMILGSSSNTLQQSRVLDLGCGYGWFVRWAHENGASYVKGMDISEKMLEKAKSFATDAKISFAGEICYEKHDLESIILEEDPHRESYDLVYSSLTFHYIEDLGRVFRQIHSALKKGDASANGKLVFSVEHPIYSAPVQPAADWIDVKVVGGGSKVWPLNSYSEEGVRVTSWLGIDGVRKYHRTTETYVSLLLENGFFLTGLKDWAPSEEDIAANPQWSVERHRPFFLLLAAEAR